MPMLTCCIHIVAVRHGAFVVCVHRVNHGCACLCTTQQFLFCCGKGHLACYSQLACWTAQAQEWALHRLVTAELCMWSLSAREPHGPSWHIPCGTPVQSCSHCPFKAMRCSSTQFFDVHPGRHATPGVPTVVEPLGVVGNRYATGSAGVQSKPKALHHSAQHATFSCGSRRLPAVTIAAAFTCLLRYKAGVLRQAPCLASSLKGHD